ncbi:MAG: sigma-70 family RNA polymerase sigma factor, partial [bacterium]|nr:sigma-70 family RNA polymerase sigma factor [bacterium]
MPSNPATTIGIETLLEHEPFVRSILRGLVSDENQVQDLVQETWVRAMRRPPQEAGAIKGWLTRVAKNLVRDSHRRNATRTHCEHTASRSEEDTSVAVSEERLRLHQQILGAVMSLQEPYRSVMILTYYEDLSAREIATKLDRKPATVRSQIHRAHDSLRSQLDADYGNRKDWMLIATPMLKWEKPAVAKATGFTLAQIASYAAVAACLIATGLWVESLLSVPASDADASIDGEGQVVLQAPTDGVSGSKGSATSSKSSEGTDEDYSAMGNGNSTGAALAAGSTGQERTLPLMEWSVLVTQDGKPVEGAEVVVRM